MDIRGIHIPEEYSLYLGEQLITHEIQRRGKTLCVTHKCADCIGRVLGGVSRIDYVACELAIESIAVGCWAQINEIIAYANDNTNSSFTTQNFESGLDGFETELRRILYCLRLHRELGAHNGWVTPRV